MEKVDLTLSIEKMKLDALTYALSQKGSGTPQQALEQRFKELYEEAVAPELRVYIDYMIAAQAPRSHAKKSAKPAPAPTPAQSAKPPAESEEKRNE